MFTSLHFSALGMHSFAYVHLAYLQKVPSSLHPGSDNVDTVKFYLNQVTTSCANAPWPCFFAPNQVQAFTVNALLNASFFVRKRHEYCEPGFTKKMVLVKRLVGALWASFIDAKVNSRVSHNFDMLETHLNFAQFWDVNVYWRKVIPIFSIGTYWGWAGRLVQADTLSLDATYGLKVFRVFRVFQSISTSQRSLSTAQGSLNGCIATGRGHLPELGG